MRSDYGSALLRGKQTVDYFADASEERLVMTHFDEELEDLKELLVSQNPLGDFLADDAQRTQG